MGTSTIAVVTGGSRGIGRALCLELAGRGAHVYTCARDEAALEELSRQAEELDGTVEPTVADVTNLDEMSALFERVRDEHGRLDVLVNNAGVLGPRTPIEDVDLADWQKTQSVNVDGVFIASKLAIDLLRGAESSMIMNVSSSVGRRGRGGWGPYAVSKHGVEGLTDTLADELVGDGVCVVSINPGGTATDMRHEAYPDEDPATLPTAEQVAKTFALLIERLDVEQTGRKYNSRDLMDDVGDETNGEGLPYVG